MKSNTEAQSSDFDGVKWGFVVLIVSAAVAGNLYFSDYSPLYRVIGVLIAALVAGFIALKTEKGRRFADMAAESRAEIRKVVWPTRQETTQTTLIVLAAVLFMGLVLWGIDSLLGWIVSMIVE